MLMVLLTPKDLRLEFLKQFRRSFYDLKKDEGYDSYELGVRINNKNYIISAQARVRQDTTENFRKKINYTVREVGDYFLPVFLGGPESVFISKPNKSTIVRVGNCDEKTSDLYHLQERVRVALNLLGKIIIYTPSEPVPLIQIYSGSLANAKNKFPQLGLDHQLGTRSADIKFKERPLERTLHLELIQSIELRNLGLKGGQFADLSLPEEFQ